MLFICGTAHPYERSGVHWCRHFPNSNSLTTLHPQFKAKARAFVDAMREAGATVAIASTRRPDQRQYLMHWSYRIGYERYWFEATRPCIPGNGSERGIWFPPNVPAYSDPSAMGTDTIGILWYWFDGAEEGTTIRGCSTCPTHYHRLGASVAAAAAMADAYEIRYRPGRTSRHTEGNAIDMTISWSGSLAIQNRDGTTVTIASTPKNGSNPQLHSVGASYGVYKLVGDRPHWSSDGH